LIYDTELVVNGEWKKIYDRRKDDPATMSAPFRIWSGVKSDKVPDVLKFIDKAPANDNWKRFMRGQIYAETNKLLDAAKEFAKVQAGFININDYLYLMSFYKKHDMGDAATALRNNFTATPGGIFMLNYDDYQTHDFFGAKNALAFGLIQSVSHNQMLSHSDLSLLLLRAAQQVGGKNDALNYYIGVYFLGAGGDYKRYFDAIGRDSPFYPFALMKIAETTGKISELKRVVNSNPLFMPALIKLVAKNVQMGNKNTALRIINKALKNKNMSNGGVAHLLIAKAQIYVTANDLVRAQKELRAAADLGDMNSGILSLQAQIWAKEGRELDTAYEYAIALVKKHPTVIEFWDTLGMVVYAKEGLDAALEIWERVGRIADNYSPLFEHLGDAHSELGQNKQAIDAYDRAIDLSGDGLVMVPNLQKKIRRLK
jgi:tetratricopeptide (TPR) repeat protein